MKRSFILYFLFLFGLLSSCKNEETNYQTTSIEPSWEAAKGYYLECITNAIAYLDSLESVTVTNAEAKDYFIKAREE
ncbi:MAG: hypothetical protein V7767_06270, partial [Leeuwenhoekiella sp.]